MMGILAIPDFPLRGRLAGVFEPKTQDFDRVSFVGQTQAVREWLESNRQPRGQANVLLRKLGQLRFDCIGLNAPTQQPHQSEIDSQAESFSKRRLRL